MMENLRSIDKAYILYIDEPKSVEWAQECATSCEEHRVPFELFKGFKGLSTDELTYKTGWVCGRPGLEDADKQYVREYNAALGHIRIWEKIAAGDHPCAILEHDAIVKADFTHLDMVGDVMFLGPRVNNRNDYEFPEWEGPVTIKPTRRFEGLHAYVISPLAARFLLDKVKDMRRILPSEAMLSVRNPFDMDLRVVDPPFVLCELGGRKSFTMQDEITIPQNFREERGFLKGLKPDAVRFKTTDYVFSEDWFSGNIPTWKSMFKFMGWNNKTQLSMLEIGAYEGRSTTWLIDNMMDNQNSILVSVDTFEGSEEHTLDQRSNLFERYKSNIVVSKWPEKVRPIRADSKIVLSQMLTTSSKFDFIYVDGSHETLDVIIDGILAWQLLKPNGLIAFDDVMWDQKDSVKNAVGHLEMILPMELVSSGYQRFYKKAP
jgi:GR25 family glycosyltransferase involved in LPS biosynthesis